jgi:hypothetical protein
MTANAYSCAALVAAGGVFFASMFSGTPLSKGDDEEQ